MGVKILKGDEFVTGGVSIINTDHSAIHKGEGASANDYFTLASGAVKEYCITTPIDKYVHFKNIVLSSLGGSAKLEIIRGATVTANTGTAILANNPNDAYSTTPEATIKESPTYSGGTVWERMHVLADTTNQFTGTAQTALSGNQELVFKIASEQYILKITNLETATIKVTWRAFWHEETKGKVD